MKVYLITTIHNQETRWQHAKREMEGLTFIPVLAPDYRVFMYGGLTEQQAKHQSLTMAYLQIAQTTLFNGETQHMVVEDDISFLPIFEEVMIKMIDSLPADWHFLYVTKTIHNQEAAKTIPVNNYVCKVLDNWWQTPITLWNYPLIEYFVYYISNKLAKELWLGHIDHELVKICQTGQFIFYGAEKNIANGLSSENGEEFEAFKKGSLTELKQENISL